MRVCAGSRSRHRTHARRKWRWPSSKSHPARRACRQRSPLHRKRADNERQRQGAGGQQAMTIGPGHYLTVSACLFTLGMLGIFLNRKNVIIILMSVELMLLAVNINLVAFSSYL